MIEGAGVQPEELDRPRPCERQRMVHEPAASAGADESCGDAEHADLAGPAFAKIQLQQSFIAPVRDERMRLDQRMMQPRRELGVGHSDARVPEKFLTDAAVKLAIPGK